MTLQANDFSVNDARETIRIINKYVLKVPLSDSEIETVLRDDAFKKPVFFSGSSFLFDKFATFLKNNNHIIKINNQLHIYKNGIYVSGYSEIEAAMIQHIPQLNRAKRTEVLAGFIRIIRKQGNFPSACSPDMKFFHFGRITNTQSLIMRCACIWWLGMKVYPPW